MTLTVSQERVYFVSLGNTLGNTWEKEDHPPALSISLKIGNLDDLLYDSLLHDFNQGI